MLIDRLILLAAILLLFGIASSKFATRLGLPVLVLFVGVGMLAGSDGLGGIAFDSYPLAHGIGSLSLALILFDGGLRTSREAIAHVWRPSFTLATVGVLVTAALTGLAASLILGIPVGEGLLLGAIVGSTDAAAVFSVLRSQGLRLPEHVSATLEIESGSNDPMAIFLTVAMLELLMSDAPNLWSLGGMFVVQMGIGAAVGLLGGWASLRGINAIDLGAAGLYPVLTGTCGLLAFGLAASMGGSGFLAIYLVGIVLGNNRLVFQRGTLLFFDGIAWVAQITMFVVLGLLSYPSRLLAVAPQGLLIALVLVFVARPVAVALSLWPFGFTRNEGAFVAWGGLRGAVPILLATFPLLAGLERGELLFDVVFFVVLTSAIAQGWTMPSLAASLGLLLPSLPRPAASLEITSLRDVDADIVEYTVPPGSGIAHRPLSDVRFPEGAVVALIARDHAVIPPKGSTVVLPGDNVFVVVGKGARPAVEAVFEPEVSRVDAPADPPTVQS